MLNQHRVGWVLQPFLYSTKPQTKQHHMIANKSIINSFLPSSINFPFYWCLNMEVKQVANFLLTPLISLTAWLLKHFMLEMKAIKRKVVTFSASHFCNKILTCDFNCRCFAFSQPFWQQSLKRKCYSIGCVGNGCYVHCSPPPMYDSPPARNTNGKLLAINNNKRH